MKPLLVAPSLLSSDFAELDRVLAGVAEAGAEWVHLDVMDGRFVPNLTFGPPVIKAMRRHSNLTFDTHLMMVEPERYVEAFAAAGSDAITVHAEVSPHLHRTLVQIRNCGKKAGVAYNPSTGIEGLEYVIQAVDLVLIMTVNPGFGGQRFLASVLPKIAAVRRIADDAGVDLHISVDGGVDVHTAGEVRAAGANVLVAGTAVFHTPDWAANIAALRQAAGS